ncbi:MAG: chromosome segregation protein SMC [Gammaproteobacteria bacterium]|jgi:chromosome segregation protein
MRLKQIKLIGFKSFVDPTILHLNAQLIGIVGPNGCGKSNIIDAVRWVLGESSAKDLRGESMADVIFNGSTARKPVGQAAIELLFDNLEGKLDREYANFSEVAIRREVDRSRQSEYYLNDKKCRKRDITDLFAGTGLLQNGYAIIGQGTVSKIIESKPEDLRCFVEEAADISIYKKRRHETELRMQHTEENLNRLQDLLSEQVRLLEKLEKQQLAAKKYQQYQADKQNYEIKLLSIKVDQFNKQLVSYEQEIKQISVELEQYLVKKTNIGLQLERYKLEQADQFDQFSKVQEEYYALGANIAKLEQTLKYKKEQKNKCQTDLASLKVELTKLQQQHIEDQKLQENLNQELLLINQQYTELEQIKNDVEQKHKAAQLEIEEWYSKFNKLQVKFSDANNRSETIKSSIEQIESLAKELYFRVEKLNQESTSYNIESLITEIVLLETALRKEEELQLTQRQQLLQITELAKQKKIFIKNLLEQKSKLQAEIHKLLGTVGAMRALHRDVLEINSAKSTWLEKAALLTGSLFFEQLIIEDGWEIAVGVILGRYLDAMVLPDNININEISMDLLQDVKDFRLVLIDEAPVSQKLHVDNIEDKISILSKIKNNCVIENLFKNIYIAEDLTLALARRKDLLSDQYFVTKKGELVGVNWLLIDKLDLKQQVLLRNKELLTLEVKLQQLEKELINLNSELDVGEQDLINIEQQQAIIVNSSKEEEGKIRVLITEISAKKSKLDSIKQRSEKIVIEIKEYQTKLQELSAKEINLRANLRVAIEESSDCTEQKQLLSDQKVQLQKTLDQGLEYNKIAINKFHEVALHKQSIITKVHGLDESKQRILNQIQTLKEKQVALQKDLQENDVPLQPLELRLEALLDDRLAQEKQLGIVKSELDEIEYNIKQLEQNSSDLNITVEQYRAKVEQLKLEQNRVATRVAAIMENVDGQTLEQNLDIADLEVWQSKLDAVIKNLERLGAVNLAAIEEFNLESERKTYLDLQCEDLTTALTTLKEAITKIDSETKKKFKTTFEQINSNFQKLFPKLFGGGSASLELTTDDWLVSGVGVLAQPPGKKNSTIYLLSGGEKALTAVALIFAIFQLNPAPFCILDEVDAPLDDANVTRFSELLIDLSTQVQFIFITHNKTTMKIANQLTGVTMKEPGVSRLVSVNVDEAAEMVN